MQSAFDYLVFLVAALLTPLAATSAQEKPQLKVLMSAGFSAAYKEVLPEFERTTGIQVTTATGQSVGNNPNAIRAQLRRGVTADVVILSREGVVELIEDGRILPGTDTDLAETPLGVAVRTGAPKPDISTVDAFKRTLLRAKAVAFTSSTSGVYLTTVLFPKLGIADEMAKKSTTEAAAAVVRGDAELAVQPVSELIPVAGLDFVGKIPAEIQKVNVYAAAVVSGSRQVDAAKRLIAFLSSDSAAAAKKKNGMEPSRGQEFAGREKLRAHTNEFRREVIKVTDGVYVAVGYSLANAILIQGDGGSIIVDTTSSVADAREVQVEFAKVSSAPVRAIIYTHFHPDHTGGATVFAGSDKPDVYSHQLLVERAPDVGRAGRDGGNQFGSGVPDSLYLNAGIGPQIGRRPASGGTAAPGATPTSSAASVIQGGYLRPTQTFADDRKAVTIAGVRLELLHTPGETSDAISVWLPDQRVLMPGDDFYRAFPNLYAIRGVRLRPVDQWVASLGKMIDLGAEHLVPSHTRPIAGSDSVRAALTAYRDGIKSILDQTLEGMKKGERPDELVQHVKLPPHLAENPYLQEFYGTVAWSVRAIYTDYLGWFDGNATHLFPLAENDRASKILALAGGADRVLAGARDALAAGEFQWAAELADYVLAVDASNADAKRLKAQALTELGERQISANARNFYLSAAQFLLRGLPPR